jgi:hypothetical protein
VRWTRRIFSLWLGFHVFCLVFSPNANNWLGTKVAFVVEPYVNTLEISSPWNFFAPDPGPPPVFVEWELLDDKTNQIGTGRFPTSPDPFLIRERQNRRISLARFLVQADDRSRLVMGRELCRKHPEAFSVRIWRVIHTLPGLGDVVSGKRKIGDDVGQDRRFAGHEFCERGGAAHKGQKKAAAKTPAPAAASVVRAGVSG